MMKAILLAGATMLASPLLAQTASPAGSTKTAAPVASSDAQQAQPTTPEAAPPMSADTTGAPAQTPTTQAPAASAAQTTTTPATPDQAPAQTAEAQPATAQPATDATQVAAVIDADFGKYDVNKDGNLSKEEFGSWMVALKKASDPAVDAASTETTTWVGKAFAQADTDKSAAISKPELNKFLAPQAG